MYIIKIKNKNLFYNNRNDYGFHDNINKADIYNSKKGAIIALNSLKRWWKLGIEDSFYINDYHSYIKDFEKDVEIRKVVITVI